MRNSERSVLVSLIQRGMELLPELYPGVLKNDSPMWRSSFTSRGPRRWKKLFWRGRSGIALLTTFPKHADLYYDLIQEEQLVLIVNRDCALAKQIRPGTPIDILEAKDETFVSSRPGHSVRSIQDALFITRDMKPKIDLETSALRSENM